MGNIVVSALQLLAGQLDVVAQVIGGLLVLLLCGAIWWHLRQRAAKKLGMASWYFIAPCIFISALAAVAAAYGIGLRSGTVIPEAKGKESTQFVRLEKIKRDGPFSPTNIELVATGTFERLRIYLDFASSKASMLEPLEWNALNSILIGDWRDVAPEMRKTISIIYSEPNEQPTSRYDFYWGNPEIKQDHPIQIVRANNRARIRVFDSGKEPQVFSLLVMRVPFDNEGVLSWNKPIVTVIGLDEAKTVFGPELSK